MTSQRPLYVDTSALLRRYLADPDTRLVIDAMTTNSTWCSSSVTRTEALMALHHVSHSQHQHDEFKALLTGDWDAFIEIPIDDRCLSRAAEIGARFRIRIVDAIHLAAADRLPKPCGYLTLQREQLAAAAELGFHVVTAGEDTPPAEHPSPD